MFIKVVALCVFVTGVVFVQGCIFYRTDYGKFDARCRTWIQDVKANGMSYANDAAIKIPDAKSKYAYFVCVNDVTGMMMVSYDIFYDVPIETVEVVKGLLLETECDFDAWNMVNILKKLHLRQVYNVASDAEMVAMMKQRVSVMKVEIYKEDAEATIRKILSGM